MPVLVAVAGLALSGQPVHASSAPGAEQPSAGRADSSSGTSKLQTVTIQARRELQRQVDQFVTTVIAQPWGEGESLLRWNKPICPIAGGLPREFDEFMEAHISQIARSAHAPVAGGRCRPNFYVIATYHPERLLKKLWARRPWIYSTRNGLGGVERFMHSRRAVRAWYNAELRCRAASISPGIGSDMMMVGPSGGHQVNTASPYYCAGGGPRLSYSAVNAMSSVLIVVDLNRMQKITARQLADYIAMVGLADVRLGAEEGAVPTILHLFRHSRRAPRGLSTWDRALLASLYKTRQASVLQVSDMESAVLQRLVRTSDSEQASSRSSRAALPQWVNEDLPTHDAPAIYGYRIAAEQGNARASYELATMYAKGEGVPQDYVTAAFWYREAAKQGSVPAQSSLGSAYADGQGVPRNYAKAVDWYHKAAGKGDVAAQYDLGVLYAKGQGVRQSYGNADRWFRRAAEQGDANAQSSLGMAYANAQGVPRNYAKAAQWFRRAAAHGNSDAQYDLGVLCATGQGVPRDDVKAYKWWMLAGADSRAAGTAAELSAQKAAILKRMMTADQLTRARREASRWLAEHRIVR
jgi:TPR repeat protein